MLAVDIIFALDRWIKKMLFSFDFFFHRYCCVSSSALHIFIHFTLWLVSFFSVSFFFFCFFQSENFAVLSAELKCVVARNNLYHHYGLTAYQCVCAHSPHTHAEIAAEQFILFISYFVDDMMLLLRQVKIIVRFQLIKSNELMICEETFLHYLSHHLHHFSCCSTF